MKKNVNIDPGLLDEAHKVGGLKSKEDTVVLALKEFIQRRRQLGIIALFGSIHFADDYDYKQHRNSP